MATMPPAEANIKQSKNEDISLKRSFNHSNQKMSDQSGPQSGNLNAKDTKSDRRPKINADLIRNVDDLESTSLRKGGFDQSFDGNISDISLLKFEFE